MDIHDVLPKSLVKIGSFTSETQACCVNSGRLAVSMPSTLAKRSLALPFILY